MFDRLCKRFGCKVVLSKYSSDCANIKPEISLSYGGSTLPEDTAMGTEGLLPLEVVVEQRGVRPEVDRLRIGERWSSRQLCVERRGIVRARKGVGVGLVIFEV